MSLEQGTWPLVIMAAVIGAFALLTGSPAERALGGLALAVAAALAWAALRGRRSQSERSDPEDLQFRAPDLTVGERLLPWIFFSVAVLIVVAMTAFTLWYIGAR